MTIFSKWGQAKHFLGVLFKVKKLFFVCHSPVVACQWLLLLFLLLLLDEPGELGELDEYGKKSGLKKNMFTGQEGDEGEREGKYQV